MPARVPETPVTSTAGDGIARPRQTRADSPAGLAAGTDGGGGMTAGLAGWAGRNSTARMAPTAATPPATRQPTDSPCRKAFVAASCTARPTAPGTRPETAYAAPSDWCAMALTGPG